MQSYYSIIGHVPYAIYSIAATYLSYNWRFVSFKSLLSISPVSLPPFLLATTCLFSVSQFLFHFVLFFRFHIYVKSYDIGLPDLFQSDLFHLA